MSQLFDKYKRDSVNVPDNQKVFIKAPREYKDVIVIGGTNTHTFLIPYNYDEIIDFSITYVQGTETILTKHFEAQYFERVEEPNEETEEQENTETEEPSIIEYVYNNHLLDCNENGSVLYQVTKEHIKDFYEDTDEDELDNDLIVASCVLFYNLSPEESAMFNDWNREVYVQLRADIDINVDVGIKVSREYSRRYKIKILKTLQEKEDND